MELSSFPAARVVSENRGIFQLLQNSEYHLARLPGAWTSEIPVTGDWVHYDLQSNRIVDLCARHSKISRKRVGRAMAEQVLAANVDVMFIVSALDHDFSPRRVERFLMVASENQIEPVILLNKSDLCDDPLPLLQQMDRAAPNISVVLLSALNATSVSQLHRYIQPDQTAVLIGSSGVGKSTILNQLLEGEKHQPTQPVREADSKGRHTTSQRQLFPIPQGWFLIDTPGLREIEPWASPEAADSVFADITSLAANCHFRDCTHLSEPGCAVQSAVQQGTLDAERLANFHKLRRGMEYIRRMEDIHVAQEVKRKWKAIHKAMRHFYK